MFTFNKSLKSFFQQSLRVAGVMLEVSFVNLPELQVISPLFQSAQSFYNFPPPPLLKLFRISISFRIIKTINFVFKLTQILTTAIVSLSNAFLKNNLSIFFVYMWLDVGNDLNYDVKM